MVAASTLSFLQSLKKNNNKAWFEKNREKYVAARNDFENLTGELLKRLSAFDPDMKTLSVKDCVFRINRDIRFSKDKTPYKTSLSASFVKGGKKSVNAGYYFQISPDGNSFAGGGLWMPGPQELKKLRQEIDYCYPEFKKILLSPAFKKNYGDLEREKQQMLVNVPKGYEKDNPAADYLKLKSFVASKYFSDSDLVLPGFATEISAAFKGLFPLVKFINRSFE